jgi:hypothetical protein
MKIFNFYLGITLLFSSLYGGSNEVLAEINSFSTSQKSFNLLNPFSKITPKKEVITTPLSPTIKPQLIAIIGNKACINGEWVSHAERYAHYRITHVTPSSVVIFNHSTKKYHTLTLAKVAQ